MSRQCRASLPAVPRVGAIAPRAAAMLGAVAVLGVLSGPAAAATGAGASVLGIDAGMARTALLCVHVLGVALGMGAAIMLDLMMARHLYAAPLTRERIAVMHLGGRVVCWGFGLLCVSGIGFLALYWIASPEKLGNHKLWAKVLVADALLVNAMLIHGYAMPRLESALRAPLLAGKTLAQALPFLAIGALSACGWVFAFILGMVRELNFAYQGEAFLAAFACLYAFGLGGACLLHLWRGQSEAKAASAKDEARWGEAPVVISADRLARALATRAA